MTQPEQPWMPANNPADLPFAQTLVNPHGDRHLALDTDAGQWYRLWQYQPPQPLHTGEAILLRPSDIDQIIQFSVMWVQSHPQHPRWRSLTAELADGAKYLVRHYADLAGAK